MASDFMKFVHFVRPLSKKESRYMSEIDKYLEPMDFKKIKEGKMFTSRPLALALFLVPFLKPLIQVYPAGRYFNKHSHLKLFWVF